MKKTIFEPSFGEKAVQDVYRQKIDDATKSSHGDPLALDAQRRDLEGKMRDAVDHKELKSAEEEAFTTLMNSVRDIVLLHDEVRSIYDVDNCFPEEDFFANDLRRRGVQNPEVVAKELFLRVRNDPEFRSYIESIIDRSCRTFVFSQAMAMIEQGDHFPHISDEIISLAKEKGYAAANIERFVRLLEADPAMYRDVIGEQIVNESLRRTFLSLFDQKDPNAILDEFESHPMVWRSSLDVSAKSFLEYILPKLSQTTSVQSIAHRIEHFFMTDVATLEEERKYREFLENKKQKQRKHIEDEQRIRRERLEEERIVQVEILKQIAKEATERTENLLRDPQYGVGISPESSLSIPTVSEDMTREQYADIVEMLTLSKAEVMRTAPNHERDDVTILAFPSVKDAEHLIIPSDIHSNITFSESLQKAYGEFMQKDFALNQSAVVLVGPLKHTSKKWFEIETELRELEKLLQEKTGRFDLKIIIAPPWIASVLNKVETDERRNSWPVYTCSFVSSYGMNEGKFQSQLRPDGRIERIYADAHGTRYYPMVILPH